MTAVLSRVFTMSGDVRSPNGWVKDSVDKIEALTDIEAIKKFKTGINHMRVKKITVGGKTIWKG